MEMSTRTALGLQYHKDIKMKQLADRLTNAAVEPWEHGLEVLELPCVIIPDDATQPKLITREHSRGACESAIVWLGQKGSNSRAIILGSPRIGKSWSLLYCLLIVAGRESAICQSQERLVRSIRTSG